ncbi:glycoside hydrolase family 5 protein [Mycolicibacterium septicum DSM 44393]|uniref:Glycoside hydrolase family 5 protein n=1 Tax=Mycolicibacterium septicum DSM 44393 TaxID=1341646 RepID=A0A7X6MMB4_9MYCO|nr:cellulase family glycosylhydrolase [Mycolicibacterium septicum]NKZ11430.1 glycoside hydrolase family 5 protein [Mycolicibacterium septicum DSM 44393]
MTITPTSLLRAKIAAGSLALAVLAGTAVAQPPDVTAAAQPRHVVQIDVQLLTGITDTSTALGIADSTLYNLDQGQLVERLNAMKSLGVTDLRIGVPWVYIQPTSSTSYDWTKMDNVVNTATSMGFSITADITGNPAWDGVVLAGAPDPTAYANFASTVATRYGNKIYAYEIWNEPNGVVFYAPVSAASYTAVLKAAYTAIKAANPDATVLAGALGATKTFNGISVSPQQFLDQMYAAGAGGYFDALSYHPYHYTLPFSAGEGVTDSPLEQVRALYSIMAANGDGDLKIWATEYGTATTPGIGNTQAEQAQLMQDFLTAWSRISFAGPAFIYTAQDIRTGDLNAEANFGLFTSDGKPKQSALILAALIAEFDSTGSLTDYTAPKMSLSREVYLQLASLGFGFANLALIIPNAVVAAALSAMPVPVRQAFAAVADAVSVGVARVVTAIAPIAQAGIDVLINAGPNLHNAKITVKHAAQQIGDVITENLHNTQLTLQNNVRSTGLTLAGAIRGTQITLSHLHDLNVPKAAISPTDSIEASSLAAQPDALDTVERRSSAGADSTKTSSAEPQSPTLRTRVRALSAGEKRSELGGRHRKGLTITSSDDGDGRETLKPDAASMNSGASSAAKGKASHARKSAARHARTEQAAKEPDSQS